MSYTAKTEMEKIKKMSAIFGILADPSRCKIIKVLAKENRGMCVYEIAEAVELTHSATSHQFNKMEDNQILTSFREGQTICYEIADTKLAKNLVKVFDMIYNSI